MQYDDGKYMTEHKTDKIMRSSHLDRQRGKYIPWGTIVQEHNMKPKKLIDRKRDGWRSNPTVFMSM